MSETSVREKEKGRQRELLFLGMFYWQLFAPSWRLIIAPNCYVEGLHIIPLARLWVISSSKQNLFNHNLLPALAVATLHPLLVVR